jgi:uncharacterized protein
MSNENIARMRQGYEAFAKGDLDALRDLFAPDIVWHAPGNNPLTGDYKGIDEVFGYFGKLFEATNGDMKQEIHDLLANDTHGVGLTHVRASRPDGRTMSLNQVAIFHINDQLVNEAWIMSEDPAAADAFFA